MEILESKIKAAALLQIQIQPYLKLNSPNFFIYRLILLIRGFAFHVQLPMVNHRPRADDRQKVNNSLNTMSKDLHH